MEERREKSIEVQVSKDGLEAYIKLCPGEGETYTVEQLVEALGAKKVVYGIDHIELQNIIKEKRYFEEVLVAKGTLPEDGKDGYYEFLFETDVDLRPKILEDGSVDYKSMGHIPVVEAEQELVRYHPPVPPVAGKNVLGAMLVGRKGRDLLRLKGKGFHLSEDKLVYRAAITGKATIRGNLLEVNNVLVIDSDVTTSTGDIVFPGDVIIKGNVVSGAEVHANGNIEVDGCVEAAILIAGKNVVLKNGMQGNGKGKICAGKNVSGKFFEQTAIEAKGNVSANAIMNCKVKCGDTVCVSGKYGIIVGGKIEALHEVETTLIGNMSEVKTQIEVGTGDDLYHKLFQIEEHKKELAIRLERIKNSDERTNALLQMTPAETELKRKKMENMRERIEVEAELMELQKKKEEVASVMTKTANPKVIVYRSIYPNTYLTINGVHEHIRTENYNITYIRSGLELSFRPNI